MPQQRIEARIARDDHELGLRRPGEALPQVAGDVKVERIGAVALDPDPLDREAAHLGLEHQRGRQFRLLRADEDPDALIGGRPVLSLLMGSLGRGGPLHRHTVMSGSKVSRPGGRSWAPGH